MDFYTYENAQDASFWEGKWKWGGSNGELLQFTLDISVSPSTKINSCTTGVIIFKWKKLGILHCSVMHKNSCFMYLSDFIVHSRSHSGTNFSESIN